MAYRDIIATDVNNDEKNYLEQIKEAILRKVNRLDKLQNVVESQTVPGQNDMTLVYDSESDTYNRQFINLDGGGFGNPPVK